MQSNCDNTAVSVSTSSDIVAEALAAYHSSDEQKLGTPPTCIIPGCTATTTNENSRLFPFPSDAQARVFWVQVLRTVYPELSLVEVAVGETQPRLQEEEQTHTGRSMQHCADYYVCYDHFMEKDFDTLGNLTAEAVPTQFPGGVRVVYGTESSATDQHTAPTAPDDVIGDATEQNCVTSQLNVTSHSVSLPADVTVACRTIDGARMHMEEVREQLEGAQMGTSGTDSLVQYEPPPVHQSDRQRALVSMGAASGQSVTAGEGGGGGVMCGADCDSGVSDSTAAASFCCCCVPRCTSQLYEQTDLFNFPARNFKAWISIIGAATGEEADVWLRGEREANSGRPLVERVCKEHFTEYDVKLLRGGPMGKVYPTLFEGGQKRIILKPVTSRSGQNSRAKYKQKDLQGVKGPIFVNINDDGVVLTTASGSQPALEDLTCSELKRIKLKLREKILSDTFTYSTSTNTSLALEQVQFTIQNKEKEFFEEKSYRASILTDIMSLDPDMSNSEVSALINQITCLDKQKQSLEQALSAALSDTDVAIRESELLSRLIQTRKRKLAAIESLVSRNIKNTDQRCHLLGSTNVQWSVNTIHLANSIRDRMGDTVYERLVADGFPLPSLLTLDKPFDTPSVPYQDMMYSTQKTLQFETNKENEDSEFKSMNFVELSEDTNSGSLLSAEEL